MNLEIIILSELSQTKKDKHHLYLEFKKRIQKNLQNRNRFTHIENKLMGEGGKY